MEKFDLDDISLAYWIMKRDRQKIIKDLRERTEPLSVEYCKEVANFFDKPQPTGRPSLRKGYEVAYATKQWPKNITKWDFIQVDAFHRSLIEDPEFEDIRDSWDAKDATCKAMGISERTYDKIYTQCKGHPSYAMQKQLTKEDLEQKKKPQESI
jgi:hypothetical protein